MRAEPVNRPVGQIPRNDAAADTVVVHDQIEREELNEELRVKPQRLLIERMKNRVARPIRRCASSMRRRTLAKLGRHAAERALIYLALFRPRKRHAVVLKLHDCRKRLAHHVFNRILIAQPVRPLYGIVHVPAPIIVTHIAECGANPALRSNGMAACREDL